MACLSGPDLGANKSANGYNDQENRCQGEPLAHTSHTGMTERAAMPFAGMITSHQADLTVRLVSATGYLTEQHSNAPLEFVDLVEGVVANASDPLLQVADHQLLEEHLHP